MKFLIEFWNRVTSKSPFFFKVIQYVSAAIAFISGIPALLNELQSTLHVVPPEWLLTFSNKAVWISAIVAWVISKLPIKDASTAKAQGDLPLTAKKD